MSWTQVQEEEVAKEDVLETAMEQILAHNKVAQEVKPKVEVNRKKVLKAKVSVLEEAQSIIYGDREKTYGHPAKNLKTIASMWTAYMNNMDDGNFNVTAKDVAAMMMLVKVARFANDPSHRDNLVDVCGYAALIERCDEVAK
jgi:Domain of unknown function (DUF6378)